MESIEPSADGEYKYDLPKIWNYDNIFEYESVELADFFAGADFSGVAPTATMSRYRPPLSEMLLTLGTVT